VIQQTGESTHAEEELAFSFFVQLLHDTRQAEDYYRYMQEHWPRAYFALAYQGLFLSEVKAKLAAKPQDRDICLHEAEHAFRQATRILAAKGILYLSPPPREAAHTHRAHVSPSLTHSLTLLTYTLTLLTHTRSRPQTSWMPRTDGFWAASPRSSSSTGMRPARSVVRPPSRSRTSTGALSARMPVRPSHRRR